MIEKENKKEISANGARMELSKRLEIRKEAKILSDLLIEAFKKRLEYKIKEILKKHD